MAQLVLKYRRIEFWKLSILTTIHNNLIIVNLFVNQFNQSTADSFHFRHSSTLWSDTLTAGNGRRTRHWEPNEEWILLRSWILPNDIVAVMCFPFIRESRGWLLLPCHTAPIIILRVAH